MSAWWLPGDPPAGAGPRSGGRAPGGPVPWPGSLRCSWPCCRSLSVWSCHLSPVRIASGAVVGSLFVLVVGKEQGGAGDPRPGRCSLVPGLLSARWCPAAAPPGAGPGAGRVILRQLWGLDPAAGLLVGVVALAAVVALVALFFARSLCPGPVRCAVPGPAAGCRRRGPAGCRPCGSPPGFRWSWSHWSCWSPAKSRAAG